MLILRLLFILVLLLVVLSGGMYVFTRDRRYLRFAWRVLRFAALVLLVFGLLFVLERYVLTGWKVFL
jgi:Na+-driven multidrug efflux pump